MPYLIADGARSIDTRSGVPDFRHTQSNFTISLNKPINKVVGIELLHCEIPPVPSVITNWNDYIIFYETASETIKRGTITQGYYTPDEFVSMLNTRMDAIGALTYTSTYDANTNKYQINATDTVRFADGDEAYALLVAGTITRTQYESYIRASRLIGINLGVAQTLDTDAVMAYETDLRGVRYFTLQVDVNGFSNHDLITSRDAVSFIIPKNTKDLIGYSKLNYESNYNLFNEINNINVNNVSVKVFYEDDRQEDEPFNQDIVCLFRVITQRESNMRS